MRHSILLDSKADILSYGMGEHSVVEIADALAEGKTVAEMYDIRGICYVTSRPPISDKTVVCPSYEDVKKDKLTFAKLSRCSTKNRILFTARLSSSRQRTASSSRRRRPCR